LTQKSLQRLFPTDQSMVVIIDDRADVWEWSPNLVKVIPCMWKYLISMSECAESSFLDDFFVGIGDINSAFLPKLDPMTPILPPSISSETSQDSMSDVSTLSDLTPSSTSSLMAETPPTSPSPSSDLSDLPPADNEIAKSEILKQNTMALEAQVEERPLAKKQEALQEASGSDQTNGHGPEAAGAGITPAGIEQSKEKAVRKALLKNDDAELERVRKILEEVHSRFYDEYDARSLDTNGHKRKSVPYDVRTIIPRMRMDTLAGVHILFSSVIPLDTRPEATEIWRTAHAFGAKCYTELSSRITHVVAAKVCS